MLYKFMYLNQMCDVSYIGNIIVENDTKYAHFLFIILWE